MLFKKALASAVLLGMLLTGCGAPITGLPSQSVQSMKALSLASIDNAVSKVGVHQYSTNNAFNLHVDGAESFAALQELIRSAKKSIYAEYFIWHNDKTGRAICDLLIQKKKEGLEVKVLIDTIGGRSAEDKKILDRFKAGGIEVARYPMLSAAGIFNGTRSGITLTHRKLMIVDGYQCMTGGINIGDEYARPTGYHDLMLLVQGQAARDLMSEFFTDWEFAGGSTPQWTEPAEKPSFGTEKSRIAVTSPTEKDRRREWLDVLTAAIDAAQEEINIESPYFSDDDLMEHLIAAAKRGVKVKVIVAIAHNDDELYKRLNVESARQLMKYGVELKTYPGQHFSHTKYTCIDDCWTAIGTANCDARSFHENQEIVTVVSSVDFAANAQARVFDKDWAISKVMGTLKSNKMDKHLWNSILEILDYYL